ncbi:MAG: translation initiation factor IF-1 [Candidatus Taylorbacteria bacterium]|nr:translation initiation factor IF-1 [Candidatus Taylorbacteria bacterium]
MIEDETKNSKKETSGLVVEALPDALFRVDIGDSNIILAYLSGKMRIHHIRILVGDKVRLVLDPYGGKGRITRRL